jgi:DNA (cytosine-5)-methyltransferase 1
MQKAGFRCLAGFDIDPIALNVYQRNLKSPVVQCDLAASLPLRLGALKPDVIVAGPPCQGFSTAGKREFDDPRNHLLVAAGSIAIALRPKVFIAENVPAVVSGRHGGYWEALREILRVGGFRTGEVVLNAWAHGTAQARKRRFMIAWTAAVDVAIDVPSTPGGTLRSCLRSESVDANHSPVRLARGTIDYAISTRIAQGQKLCDVRGSERAVHTWEIPKVFGKTNLRDRTVLESIRKLRRRLRRRDVGDADAVSLFDVERDVGFGVGRIVDRLVRVGYLKRVKQRVDLRHGFNGKYRRLAWDEPSLTVDTRFGNPHYFLHPSEHRGFSVREAARIQGFPDTFLFSGTLDEQFRMVGNAVPPPVGYAIGTFLRSAGLV